VPITATDTVTAACVSLLRCGVGRRRRTNKPARAPPKIAANEIKPIRVLIIIERTFFQLFDFGHSVNCDASSEVLTIHRVEYLRLNATRNQRPQELEILYRLVRPGRSTPGHQGRRSRNSLSMTEGGTMPDAQMAAKVCWRLNGLPDASASWLARAINLSSCDLPTT